MICSFKGQCCYKGENNKCWKDGNCGYEKPSDKVQKNDTDDNTDIEFK